MSFLSWALADDLRIDRREDPYPTLVTAWEDAPRHLSEDGTHFGFVQHGVADLVCASGRFSLQEKMYFAVPGGAVIRGGQGLLITRLGHRGFFHLGGPCEEIGRLRYIDGCTDSLLIPPVLMGDPCLNLLHLPARTKQTMHIHPSIRVGLIIRGAGACLTDEARIPLRPGLAFLIPANERHCFQTAEQALLVLAYHPDSDFGPTHECHPMVNRTILPAKH